MQSLVMVAVAMHNIERNCNSWLGLLSTRSVSIEDVDVAVGGGVVPGQCHLVAMGVEVGLEVLKHGRPSLRVE